MISESCDSIGELLVQYSDGELSEGESQRVAAHLSGCSGCRKELRLLGRSLDLAREVWQESAARAPALGTSSVRSGRGRLQVAACLAAGVVVLLLAAGPWLFSRHRPHSEVRTPDEIERTDQPQLAEDVDIEAIIAREARSARLAASARFLATHPALKPYKDQAERYLAEAYRGTAAADRVSMRIIPPPIKEPES